VPDLDAKLGDAATIATWLAQIDRAERDVRLAVMMSPIGDARRVEELLRALKFTNEAAALARALVGIAPIDDDPSPERARLLLAAIARGSRAHVEAYLRATSHERTADAVRAVAGDPLDVGDLEITGNDLMTELSLPAGRKIGEILRALLAEVLAEPSRNTREELLARARALA
jgi:hypothetical protein